MSINDNIEFKNAIRDIALNAHNLDSPFGKKTTLKTIYFTIFSY